MDGTRTFTIKDKGKQRGDFDLALYQNELRQFKTNSCSTLEGAFEEKQLNLAKTEAEASQTNVFATFQYDCSEHSFHKHGKASWKLYWDPTKIGGKPGDSSLQRSNVDARCAPSKFVTASLEFQKKLCQLFPDMFEYEIGSYDSPDNDDYYDDYYDDSYCREEEFTPYSGMYHTGNGDLVYAMQGESEDYTACDKECGYCGRCGY